MGDGNTGDSKGQSQTRDSEGRLPIRYTGCGDRLLPTGNVRDSGVVSTGTAEGDEYTRHENTGEGGHSQTIAIGGGD